MSQGFPCLLRVVKTLAVLGRPPFPQDMGFVVKGPYLSDAYPTNSLIGYATNDSRLNYFGPASRMTMVHPKRITRKIINCLINLGSMRTVSFP